MGKSAPKPPKAPDPVATTAAQTAGNKETAYWNAVMGNMNQTTPYGSITYHDSSNGVYDPNKAPQFSSTITLSPEQQQILDSQQANDIAVQNLGTQQIGRIANAVSTPYSYSGLGDAPSQEDIATASRRAEDAIYSRLNPQFQRDEEALRTRLINQGIGQGSEAYNTEMDSFNKAKNDARMQAILQGATYGGQLQGQALDRRNQGIQEYNAVRNAPLNEYTALTAGQQVQNPSFSQGQRGNAQAGDYQGAVQNAYQGAMNQYNAKIGQQNATTSGLFGLGGSFLGAAGAAGGIGPLFSMFSDERMKENIMPVGQENGHNVYEFNYIGDDKKYTGVMAQEVEKTHPEAVGERDGFKTVNYDMIGVKMREVG
jgi:hypothetical protein